MVLSVEHTAYTSGSIKDVWKLWEQVETWPKWDGALQSSSLQKGQKFSLDSECVLTVHGNPQPIVVRITEFASRKNFTTQGRNDLGVVTIYHEVGPSDQGVSITHKMTFEGNDQKTQQIFEKNVWPHLSGGLAKAVDALATLSGSLKAKDKRGNASLGDDGKAEGASRAKAPRKK